MKKKRMSPLSVTLVTVLITSIIWLVFTFAITESTTPASIGDTVTENVTQSENTNSTDTGSTNSTGTNVRTFVYLGASSKLYPLEDSMDPAGIFLDTFDKDELAELIDNSDFPYKTEYFASTSSATITRYLIKTDSGFTYWVEP